MHQWARRTRSGTIMSRLIRSIGVWLIVAASAASPVARGQSAATGTGAKHPPFAKAGTPRQTERIRFFDVKHIKAKLAVDTANHKVSGVVTHTISPLHPFLSQIELDCGPDLKVTKVSAGPSATPCTFGMSNGKLTIKLDKSYGPTDTHRPGRRVLGQAAARALLRRAGGQLIRRRCLSFWTQGESEDTRCWLPCYDYPNERATSEMIITVPKPLFVLSNGVLAETSTMRARRRRTTGRWTCLT